MAVLAPTSPNRRQLLLRAADSLPPFSPVVDLLLAKLSRHDVRFSEISSLMEKETVLAGNLLRVVNSALYGFAGEISSVRHGLAILGIEKTRNIVLALSMTRLWRRDPAAEGWSGARFNLHSTAVAVMSDLLVQHLPTDFPEGAFTAGLFHDLGKYLIASALPEEFTAIQHASQAGGGCFEEAERTHAGISHPELAAAALEHWNLPAPIADAVRRHHNPPPASRAGCVPLGRIVQAADACVNSLGFSFAPSEPESVRLPPEETLTRLRLADRAPRIFQEFEAEVEVLRALF